MFFEYRPLQYVRAAISSVKPVEAQILNHMKEIIMKRFVTIKSFILVFAILLGTTPVGAAERPYAASGNGVAAFITDSAGNVVGANLMLSGNGTHVGAFSGTGKIDFQPDPNDPNIVIVPGAITYVASNGD